MLYNAIVYKTKLKDCKQYFLKICKVIKIILTHKHFHIFISYLEKIKIKASSHKLEKYIYKCNFIEWLGEKKLPEKKSACFCSNKKKLHFFFKSPSIPYFTASKLSFL